MSDLIIIGAGLSGLFAAALAEEHGAKVRVIAKGIGSMLVTPGWISVADSASGDVLDAARAIAAESPDHPYALAGIDVLRTALSAFKALGNVIGLPYDGDLTANLRLPTALGQIQTPALAPRGLAAGNSHSENALFVGFDGWRDFYPALTGQRAVSIPLSTSLAGQERPWDATPTDLARAFDQPAVRAAVVQSVRPHLNGAAAVGFPAVLGLDDPNTAQQALSDQLGVPVFEMPTLPPSTPGVRLFDRLRRHLLDKGVRLQIGHPVTRGIIENGQALGAEVAAAGKPARFYADTVILATGGLYGGGLLSDDRGRIWEPVFDLPVQAPTDRAKWFADTMLAPGGHPVARFGVRVNDRMQPIGADDQPIARGLYAAGHILAQPGTTPPAIFYEGMALATVYKAVASALK
ncbi:MAG: anaerobic glycerol-3-phosphate dehydrogenase subunit B [Aggregatilineales bacterium]